MAVYIVIEVEDGRKLDAVAKMRIVTEEGTKAPSCWIEVTSILERAKEDSPSFKNIPQHTVPKKVAEATGTSGG